MSAGEIKASKAAAWLLHVDLDVTIVAGSFPAKTKAIIGNKTEQESAMIRNGWTFDPQGTADDTARVKQWTMKPGKTPGGHPSGYVLQIRKTRA